MLNALLGRKIGMTQVFGPNGTVIPVTVIEAGPCVVTQVKTVDRDGYEAVQIGFEQRPVNRAVRPQLGHLGHSLPLLKAQRKRLQVHQQELRAKSSTDSKEEQGAEGSAETAVETKDEQQHESAGTATADKQIEKLLKVQHNRQRRPGPVVGPFRVIREVDLQQGVTADKVELGSLFDVGLFRDGEAVDIVGTSKGKGFQGVMKRHGFKGGPRTHGQSDRARAPGSIGATTTPGRVFKGQRMAGHMGHERVTVQNLEVVRVDADRNMVLVKCSVP